MNAEIPKFWGPAWEAWIIIYLYAFFCSLVGIPISFGQAAEGLLFTKVGKNIYFFTTTFTDILQQSNPPG